MCIQNILSIVASVASLIIALIGAWAVFVTAKTAVCTYKQNTAIKTAEFIDKLYDQFNEEKTFKFYDSLLENDRLEISPKSDESHLLEKLLTSFDKIYNYYEQGIINEKSLSYIACEILDFDRHSSVQEYIKNHNKKYTNRKYKKGIPLPYSGLSLLAELLSKKYINRK